MHKRVSLSLLAATLVVACHGTTAMTPAVVEVGTGEPRMVDVEGKY